jgi:four helix bundle protein
MNIKNKKSSDASRAVVEGAVFDHEKLDVYQLELRSIEWLTPLLEEALRKTTGKPREVCDQLDRASLSALLNAAEGNGRRQRPARAKFFDDARGSATECAACLDAMVSKGLFDPARMVEGKVLLLRIVSMLCKLVNRFDVEAQMREEPVEYRVPSPLEPGVKMIDFGNSRTRTRTRTRTTKRHGSHQN